MLDTTVVLGDGLPSLIDGEGIGSRAQQAHTLGRVSRIGCEPPRDLVSIYGHFQPLRQEFSHLYLLLWASHGSQLINLKTENVKTAIKLINFNIVNVRANFHSQCTPV